MDIGSFSHWWATLTTPEQVFWGIALFSTSLFVLMVLLSFLGIDGDADLEIDTADADIDGGGDLNFFSVKTILAGLMMFGWTGVAAISNGNPLITSVAWAIFTGILALVGAAYLMRFLLKMQDPGHKFDLYNAVDEIGEVYLRIPPSRSGKGKVHITFSNLYQEIEAITESKTEIPTGSKVRVVEVIQNNMLRVEPL